MPVRSKQSKSLLRRRGRDAGHSSSPTTEPARAGARSRRQGGQPQDHALYTCSCGFAFDAPVSTSVGCPHCGRTQAW